jgi:hypothetical protein
MARHAFNVFPKPGVGCSIQPGSTIFRLLRAISPVTVWAVRPGIGPNADILPTRRGITVTHAREPDGIAQPVVSPEPMLVAPAAIVWGICCQ